MEQYAPTLKDLAPRDMVSRAIAREIREGRGIDGKDFVHLDLSHLGKDRLDAKLNDISSFVRIYLGIDPADRPIPVQPTCHYMMGGIPTSLEGQVLNSDMHPVEGLYAAGECACVSVHGANRLGCNSLLDLVVFGRRAGKRILGDLENAAWNPLPKKPDRDVLERIQRLKGGGGGEKAWVIRRSMQEVMMEHCSVFRTKDGLGKALDTLQELIERYDRVGIGNRGKRFNTELLEAIELESLLGLAQAILISALAREESRGAHYREDFPDRDDET